MGSDFAQEILSFTLLSLARHLAKSVAPRVSAGFDDCRICRGFRRRLQEVEQSM